MASRHLLGGTARRRRPDPRSTRMATPSAIGISPGITLVKEVLISSRRSLNHPDFDLDLGNPRNETHGSMGIPHVQKLQSGSSASGVPDPETHLPTIVLQVTAAVCFKPLAAKHLRRWSLETSSGRLGVTLKWPLLQRGKD